MTSTVRSMLPRLAMAAALCAAIVGLAGRPADARVFVGIGVPFYGPGFYGPYPYYYPPPAYYPPPVVYSPPPQPQYYSQAPMGRPYGQTCYAGPLTCPMERPTAPGAGCYCTASNGSRVWGRAN
ncbi:MAG TPA: hypothetical protein VFG12_14705 [Rhodopila sp.]|jgi:hypothetical protein|nr:hypothetical protein [Rhodopila sp.]